jgi:hypothetical protein
MAVVACVAVFSRNGILAVTAVASALLSLPLVAIGKGPPEGVGGGPGTALPTVPPQANVPNSPPGQVNRPDPAPHGAPPGQVKPDEAPSPGPPAEAPPASTPGSAHAKGTTPAQRGHHTAAPSLPEAPAGPAASAPDWSSPDKGAQAGGDAGQVSHPDSPDVPERSGAVERSPGGNGGVAGAVDGSAGDDTMELMPDASPASLPFTGFQLTLMAIFGLAAIAAGAALWRGARQRRA